MRLWARVAGAVLLGSSGSLAVAQTASDPPLHRRPAVAVAQAEKEQLMVFDASRSTLPADVSGEYLIDEAGSTIEITLEAKKISGYVTRMGDEQSDKETPLTFFFDRVTARAGDLSFATKKVHGVWYEFEGSIHRGDAKTPRDENGYYLLRGVWIMHDDARGEPVRREVSFKSTPRPASL